MYSIYFLSIAVFLLLLLFFKQIKITKNLLLTILLSSIILYFILKPQNCMDYTLQGLKLFMKSVFPTIFPFLVICNMLIEFNGIEIYSKMLGRSLTTPMGLSQNSNFALVASIFCGYPIGARYACELYENSYIDRNEFDRLINIASNSGPIFTIGALGVGMMGNRSIGVIIMISCYLSAFLIGILTRKATDTKKTINKYNLKAISSNDSNTQKSMGTIIKDAVTDGLNGIMLIGGYIILFSILINIIKDNNITKTLMGYLSSRYPHANDVYGVFLGMIDLTNGCSIITSSNLNIKIQTCILSFFCAFGSLSVVAQANSFFYKFNVDIKKYIMIKLVQGLAASLITFIIISFMPSAITAFASNSDKLNLICFRGEIAVILLLILSTAIYKLFHIA